MVGSNDIGSRLIAVSFGGEVFTSIFFCALFCGNSKLIGVLLSPFVPDDDGSSGKSLSVGKACGALSLSRCCCDGGGGGGGGGGSLWPPLLPPLPPRCSLRPPSLCPSSRSSILG